MFEFSSHSADSPIILLFKVLDFLYQKFSDVTDVCMDESAVSSDPVIAFLLDEVVVKDWCKRASRNIIAELQEICKLNLENLMPCILLWSAYLIFICLYVYYLFHFQITLV